MRLPQNESELWRRLNKYGPKGVSRERVEARNPPGLPDVYWMEALHSGGKFGWIELKSQVPVIRKEQRLWLHNARKHKTRAHILAEWQDRVYLIEPLDVGPDLRIPYDKAITSVPYESSPLPWAEIWDHIATRA